MRGPPSGARGRSRRAALGFFDAAVESQGTQPTGRTRDVTRAGRPDGGAAAPSSRGPRARWRARRGGSRPSRPPPAAAPCAARRAPISRSGWRTVVSGGEANRAIWVSSKPTTLRSSGTRRPRDPGRLDDARARSRRCRRRSPSAARAGRAAPRPPPARPRSGSARSARTRRGTGTPAASIAAAVAVQPGLVAGRRRRAAEVGDPPVPERRAGAGSRPGRRRSWSSRRWSPWCCGRFIGSMTTSGSRARDSAVSSAAVSSLVDRDHGPPAGGGQLAAQAAAGPRPARPRGAMLTTTATPSSAAGRRSRPATISVE